ncbi:MAG: hypothetical protein ACYC46_04360 [Acidobacteriaceae bacterium]
MQTLDAKPLFSTPSIAASSGFPRWHIFSSLILHATVVLIGWYLSLNLRLVAVIDPVRITAVAMERNVIYLPPLTEAGTEGAGDLQKHSSQQAPAAANEHRNQNLMVYDGPQHIISNPPDADNSLQTLLQPDLKNPVRLTHPVALQNVVKIARPQLILPTRPPEPAPQIRIRTVVPATSLKTSESTSNALLALDPSVPSPEIPKLSLPVLASKSLPEPQKAVLRTAHLPRPTQAAPGPAPNNASADPQTFTQGMDHRNLLVVNAMTPAVVHSSEQIPQGELHGGFEVASVLPPEVPLAASGATTRGTDGSADGEEAASTGTSSSNAHGGTGEMHDGNAASSASSAGTGREGSSGRQGRGMGSGMSIGRGNGPFPHITIQGGVSAGNRDTAAASLPQHTPPHPENYGMTIVSSGSSGGGLRDFGVFRDGPVYTVYLNMASLGIRGRSWILQYGAAPDVRQAHHNSALVPPYVLGKVLPQLPSQLALALAGRMMVVQAQINAEGKLESLHTLQSPDKRLNSLMEACLMKWIFQPAMMEEQAVPVKILLGIPLASAMAQPTVLP